MGVDVLEALDADAVRRWSRAAVESLDAHRAEIDELNVFPVPDRDTGTNLSLTMRAAADALAADGAADAGAALHIFARGAVLGARGNSGVILSQLLRGLADAVADAPTCDGVLLRAGLQLGAVQARAAVAQPVEGTILTVASAAADAAASSSTLVEVVRCAAAAADEALQRTPQQLPVLAQAGVVDAGGRGLVLLLDALAPPIGAVIGTVTQLNDTVLGFLLAVFSGVFLAIGAGHLLPEAQHGRPGSSPTLVLIAGAGAIVVLAIRLVLG